MSDKFHGCSQEDYDALINCVQSHKCNSKCYRTEADAKENKCKSGFPHEERQQTGIKYSTIKTKKGTTHLYAYCMPERNES